MEPSNPLVDQLPPSRLAMDMVREPAGVQAKLLPALVLLSALGVATSSARAAQAPELGFPPTPKDSAVKRVVQRSRDFCLRDDRGAEIPHVNAAIMVYTVEQTDGKRLKLKAHGPGQSGWASADQVVPVEQGVAFFSEPHPREPQRCLLVFYAGGRASIHA